MVFREPLRVAAWCLAFAMELSIGGVGYTADWAPGPPPVPDFLESDGVPCSAGAPFWAPPAATAAVLPWPSVWLGHFSGGRPYTDAYGQTLVDWRDEKHCFPSRRLCNTWIGDLRRAYHRPEGYWTCLLLR